MTAAQKLNDQAKPLTSLEDEAQPILINEKLNLILDIPLRVSVEVGRTKIAVRDLINYAQGSIIELSKIAGEPMDIFVNDKLIAKGEIITINEKLGVRLIDIVSHQERINNLK